MGRAVSLAISRNDFTAPFLDGIARIDGLDLTLTEGMPGEIFWRQLTRAEFDISEMSLSTLMMARSLGDDRFVALPIFTSRHFFHTNIWVRTDRGIETPRDLAGKRIGVPEFQMTAAVWARAALRDEFGLAPNSVRWFTERGSSRSHAAAIKAPPPMGMDVVAIAADDDLGSMLQRGDIDAVLFYIQAKNLVDRSTASLSEMDNVRPLFPDSLAEARRYYAATGVFPPSHTMVMKRSLYEEDPALARTVVKAFSRVKDATLKTVQRKIRDFEKLGALSEGSDKSVHSMSDAFDYGMSARNQNTMRLLASHLVDQGLLARNVDIAEVFAATTMT